MKKKMYMIPKVEEVFFTPKEDICQGVTPGHPQGDIPGFLVSSPAIGDE